MVKLCISMHIQIYTVSGGAQRDIQRGCRLCGSSRELGGCQSSLSFSPSCLQPSWLFSFEEKVFMFDHPLLIWSTGGQAWFWCWSCPAEGLCLLLQQIHIWIWAYPQGFWPALGLINFSLYFFAAALSLSLRWPPCPHHFYIFLALRMIFCSR